MFDRVLIYNCEKGGDFVPSADLASLEARGVTLSSKLDDAIKYIESAKYYVPILIAPSFSDFVQKFFQTCTRNLNGLNEFYVLITNDPDPQLQGSSSELGIKNIWSNENLPLKLISWIEALEAKTKVESELESQMMKLGSTIARARRNNRTSEIPSQIAKLAEDSRHDYRIAFLLGQASIAVQQFEAAEKYFLTCTELNPKYIPAVISRAQLQLQNASPNEAFQMLEKLEKLNSSNSERKALLAAACADSGNWAAANKYLADAEKIEPSNSRVKEMRVRAAFEMGNVSEALVLLDRCDTIDEYFITKLNDQAISLSKNGKTQDALTLYQKAHDLASPHIKFKISFNIALAYKRQNDFAKALETLDIVDRETGEAKFDKSAKLRQQIKEEMTKR